MANELNLQFSFTQKQWTLLLYSIIVVFLFADQNLLSPNLSAAAKDFGFNDIERDQKLGGDIAIAFFLVGAPASFIVGCLADSRYIRRNILFGTIVLIGEGACMATYFTTTYAGLYATRALTGFSVGGALPVLSSVLGDWYPPEDQSTVMAYVGIGSATGIALGQGLSGMIGPIYGWRTPFLVVGFPAVVLAFVFMLTTIDPKRPGEDIIEHHHENACLESQRSGIDEQDYSPFLQEHDESNKESNRTHAVLSPFMVGKDGDESSDRFDLMYNLPDPCHSSTHDFFKTFIQLLKTPTVLLALLQGAPGCFPWGVINTYLNDYLSTDIGMSVQGATVTLMIFSIGVFCGMLIGAYGGKYLYIMDVRYPCILGGVMAIFGCIPLWMLINTNPVQRSDGIHIGMWNSLGMPFVAFVSGTSSGVTGPIIKSILQNVIGPDARGQAFAMFNTFDDFGRGLGPYFVAELILSMGSRRKAFNIAVCGWIFCGLFVLCTFFTIKRDQEKVKRYNLDLKSSERPSMPDILSRPIS